MSFRWLTKLVMYRTPQVLAGEGVFSVEVESAEEAAHCADMGLPVPGGGEVVFLTFSLHHTHTHRHTLSERESVCE